LKARLCAEAIRIERVWRHPRRGQRVWRQRHCQGDGAAAASDLRGAGGDVLTDREAGAVEGSRSL